MTFINIILENSSDKFAKLYGPAFKASQTPENGITIQNKSAYHVIKDCATIARSYIPLYVFGKYLDPFFTLKGKFKKLHIQEFVQSTRAVDSNYHLLCVILNKIENNKKEKIQDEPVLIQEDINNNDPYGEYGVDNDTKKYINQYKQPSDDNEIIELLCESFVVSN
jgi:hypothetical protein